MVFIVVGACFDMTATLLHAPDLSNEANPVARALLDSAHPLWSVLLYGALCQSLWLLTVCLLWAALLRHRLTIIDSLRDATSCWQFIKCLTGGARLSWRQWLFPFRISELPDMYFYVWFVAVVFVSGSIDRWYLGLEWFGLLIGYRFHVLITGILLGLTAYVTWARCAAKCSRTFLQGVDVVSVSADEELNRASTNDKADQR